MTIHLAGDSSRDTSSATISDALSTWRYHVLEGILRGMCVLGALALPLSCISVLQNAPVLQQARAWGLVVCFVLVYAALVVVTFRPRLSFTLRTTLVLLMAYSVAVLAIVQYGLSGDGLIFLFTTVTLAAVLFDGRRSFAVLLASILTLSCLAWLLTTGQLTIPVSVQANSAKPNAWVSTILNFMLLTSTVMVSQAYLVRRLSQAMLRERTARDAEKQAQAATQKAALHDGLTGLPNRTQFMAQVDRVIQRIGRPSVGGYAVLFLDLDGFKVVNDSLGHAIGDDLLIGIAQRLTVCVCPPATLARLGGDEFAIMLEEVEDAHVATQLAERILHALVRPFTLQGHEVVISASIGIMLSILHADVRREHLLRNADIAMYHAKRHGKGRYAVFDTTMHAQVMARMQLEADLRHALERDELQVYYQPIVAAVTEMVIGVEALLRWRHPQRGWVPPIEFIPIAEETGLISALGAWVLHTACSQTKRWHTAELPLVYVSVNLSARQLKLHDFVPTVIETIQASELDPQYVHLELTESSVMENVDISIGTLQHLSYLGVQLAMDDFGTGYSSLSYLKRLPLSTLKVDRSFVRDITTEPNDAAIVSATIAMAHRLHLRVVAEGVETASQLAFLQAEGCDAIQGYFVSPPVPADRMTMLLQAQQERVAREYVGRAMPTYPAHV